METFKLNDRIKVIGKNAKGRIAFIGKTHLSDGIMYGIALDKPKGRCSGEIGDVRYFFCPKDHGVFVRACQLEIDHGNLSDYSEDYNGDVIPRPVYPNYLKFSSKLNFRKSKYRSKSKDDVPKLKSPLKQDIRNKQPSDNNQCCGYGSPGKVSNDLGHNVKKKRHLSRKRGNKRTSDDENILIEKIMAEKINMQTQQIDTIRRNLKKLKTYLRWSRGFDLKENQMKNLLDSAIDSVIKNMVEVVGNNEIKHDYDHRRGDIDGEKENDVLLQYIYDLEKKNLTLVECMTKIRGFLLNSWKPSTRGKFKNDVHRKETSKRTSPSKNKCNTYSPKNFETHSEFNLSSENQHLDEIFQKDGQGERKTENIKRYLESLNFGTKSKIEESNSFGLHSKEENGMNDNSKRDVQNLTNVVSVRNYLESINNDIKEPNKELGGMSGEKSNDNCEERVNSKINLIHEETKSPISKENQMTSPTNDNAPCPPDDNSKTKQKIEKEKKNIRSQTYVSDKRLKREQNSFNKNATEDEKDPTKELRDLISNIMTNMTFNEQKELAPKVPTNELCEFISNITSSTCINEQNEKAGKDSPKFKEQNIKRSASKCHSNPNSDKLEKVANSSNKSKSEDALKSWKSVRDGKLSRSKSPKKRMHLKQTMEARQQPSQRLDRGDLS